MAVRSLTNAEMSGEHASAFMEEVKREKMTEELLS
jgi:hypothetical protein